MGHAWTVGVGLLLSLTLMGSSRKIFGDDIVKQYLIPHRVDIGVATFFNIGFSFAVQFGFIESSWEPGGSHHLLSALVVQLGYLQSLIDRRDFGLRLVVLVGAWLALTFANLTAAWQVVAVMEVLTRRIVKLFPPVPIPHIKPKRNKRSKSSNATSASDEEAARLRVSPARTRPRGGKSNRSSARKR